jgi:NAD(P)-dependent dehydrogenase (short-subunit alcohol dehydrogenase family)
MASERTTIVTGASQGIGVAVARAFLDRGYGVVGNARSFSGESFPPSPNLAFVEGDIGLATTAERIAQTAIERFGSIDHVVSIAGIPSSKPFADYTAVWRLGRVQCPQLIRPISLKDLRQIAIKATAYGPTFVANAVVAPGHAVLNAGE